MSIPEKPLLYHEKNLLDRVIDNVVGQDGPLTQSDLNRVRVAAQVQVGIDKYREAAKSMSTMTLVSEEHNSSRLGRHLEQTGKRRPPRCHAHAIVSGKHGYAAMTRVVMAKFKIRIDDSDNGCWLPEGSAATPHPVFPHAVPHSRIHRYNYYYWTHNRLVNVANAGMFRTGLSLIAKHLQHGTLPSYIMLAKGVGLPKGARA